MKAERKTMNLPAAVSVCDRMSSPAVSVASDASEGEIVAALEGRAISAVPVVDAAGRVAGIVSSTDVVRSVAASGDRRPTAAELMTSPVVVAAPDDAIDEAARRLFAARVHRLVVTVDERPIGILSARDVLAEVRHRRVAAPIGSIMTSPVETVATSDTVDEAVAKLAASNVHGLVVTEGLFPVGVFTHAEAIASRRLSPSQRRRPVEEVMSYETICLDVDTPIHRAAGYAVAMNVRRILVTKQKHLVGVLSCVDLVGVLARAPSEDTEPHA
ncbi:MAG: CBS domain-containing protein [Labilithrix sp.]|nr:CBS domain-containing protein [Labilithrix sp.]